MRVNWAKLTPPLQTTKGLSVISGKPVLGFIISSSLKINEFNDRKTNNAKIIFALSTAVIEEWSRPDFKRYNSDIEKYNEVAKRVLSEKGVIINDLYTISAGFDESLHADWVHFNEEGSEILARAVVKKILSVWGGHMWNGKKKAVTFSFDDGVSQDIRLIEIFNKYGLKGEKNL